MAALSLVCGQCGLQLKSVKEAQDHGELTGHSKFEESTEAVRQRRGSATESKSFSSVTPPQSITEEYVKLSMNAQFMLTSYVPLLFFRRS